MKKFLSVAAVAAALVSAPASANEGRVEGRASYGWCCSDSDFFAGVAAGYDFDLGANTFFGPEVSYDTNFDGGDLINLGGRLGTKVGTKGRFYVGAAYELSDIEELNAGVGYQHDFTNKMYGKVEYRRYFMSGSDLNAIGAGVGVKF